MEAKLSLCFSIVTRSFLQFLCCAFFCRINYWINWRKVSQSNRLVLKMSASFVLMLGQQCKRVHAVIALCVDGVSWKPFKVPLHSVCYHCDVSFVERESIDSFPVLVHGVYKNQQAIIPLELRKVGRYVFVWFCFVFSFISVILNGISWHQLNMANEQMWIWIQITGSLYK